MNESRTCKTCGHTEESACFTQNMDHCDLCIKLKDEEKTMSEEKKPSLVEKCNEGQKWTSEIHITGINKAPSPEDMRLVIKAANRLGLGGYIVNDVKIEIKGRKVVAQLTLSTSSLSETYSAIEYSGNNIEKILK